MSNWTIEEMVAAVRVSAAHEERSMASLRESGADLGDVDVYQAEKLYAAAAALREVDALRSEREAFEDRLSELRVDRDRSVSEIHGEYIKAMRRLGEA